MGKVIVVGGGAAGMMAAHAAAQNGHRVTLFEKNEKLGKKIYITGKGRCNVTNACDTEDFFGNVLHNPKSLYSAVYSFDASAVMDFMERNGCPLKIERGNRVFPVSDHSSDIIKACGRALERAGVCVKLKTPVKALMTEENQITGVRLTDGTICPADAVVVATGGLSYPSTGSDGDGYRFAEELDIQVEPCYPALVPLLSPDDVCKQLQGLSLRNVRVTLLADGKTCFSDMGEMLFTHQGVSGPLILSASSYLTGLLGENTKNDDINKEIVLSIDLKPALDDKQLDKRILRDFEQAKNKMFRNAVEGLFPAKLLPVMVERSGIPGEKPVHEITKKEREAFAALIRNFTVPINGTGSFSEAVITQGGVSMKEINPSTMESKKIKRLYFAGEVLDVDALTGGYNLQIAWSTGHLAGDSISE